jgi:Base plate wedge protein 53
MSSYVAKYKDTSPWKTTPKVQNYLGFLDIRPIPADGDDFLYTVESQYTHRPDLLAYDLYKTPKLWWVFMQRNLDKIQDPIYDFIPGLQIYIPKGDQLVKTLGL